MEGGVWEIWKRHNREPPNPFLYSASDIATGESRGEGEKWNELYHKQAPAFASMTKKTLFTGGFMGLL